jgi:hypothetical protein
VAERAKPRKIAISNDERHAIGETGDRQVISTTAEDPQPVAV